MADLEQRIRLILEERDLQQAENRLKDITKEQQNLAKEFKAGERSVEGFLNATRELRDEEDKLHAVMLDVNDALDQQSQATTRANDAFQRTSEGVALAGDVESGLRTIGGAAGFFGATGVERALAGGGEIFATIEALPRLKTALAGMPQVIENVIASIGVGGAVGGAVAIGAIAALSFAINKFTENTRKRADELQATISAQLSTAEFVAGGGTVQQAEQRIADIQRLNAETAPLLENLREREAALLEQRRVDSETYIFALEEELKVVQRNIAEIEEATTSREREASHLQDAVQSGRLRTEQLEETERAERDLAKARDEAVQSVERVSAAERRSVQQRRRPSKDTRIAGGRDFLRFFGINLPDPAEVKKENAEFLKAHQDVLEKEHDMRQRFAEQRVDLQRRDYDERLDSIRDFSRQRRDALGEGRFLELRSINTAERDSAEDRRTAFRRANAEINREAREAHSELQGLWAQFWAEFTATAQQGMTRARRQSPFGVLPSRGF